MFDFVFVLCCKDTTKSNNYQIFKGKSYHIVYYLMFLNRKIKHYYLFTYYLLCYCYYILYVSYYIIYLIIYRERTKANGKGRAAPRRSAILPASSSSPLPDGEGRAASQPGRGDPLRSPCRPSPTLPGCLGILADTSGGMAGKGATYQGGGRCRARLKVLGKNYKAVSL